MVVFERCISNSTQGINCQNDTVIDEWLADKYIVTLENEKLFIANEFEGDRIKTQSKIVWHALSPNMRNEYVKNVQLADLKLSDSPLSASLLTDEVKVFKLV